MARVWKLVLVGAAVVAALGSTAWAKVVRVSPGPGAFADAVAQLEPGDRLILNRGLYDERLDLRNLSNVRVIARRGAVITTPGTQNGLLVADCSDVTVSGLTVRGTGIGPVTMSNATRVRLVRCRVEDPTVRAVGVSLNLCTDVTIDRCRIQGTSTAVSVGSTNGVMLKRCRIDDIAGGVLSTVSSSNCVAVSNRITNVTGTVFGLRGQGMKMLRNRLTDTGAAVSLVIDATAAVVDRNRFVRSEGNAIFTSSSNVTITRNVIIAPSNAAVTVHSVASGVTLIRNTVRDAGATALFVNGDDTVVNFNRIFGSQEHGLRANGENGTYGRNFIRGTEQRGFFLVGTGNTLTSNNVRGSGEVDLFSSRAEADNTFVNNRFGTTNLDDE